MHTAKCLCRHKKEARVHVLYTGGTIGMIRNAAGALVPTANELTKRLRELPNCHDTEYKPIFKNDKEPPLVLPPIEGLPHRVLYDITEFNPLLDSSCISMPEWQHMANVVGECYDHYDGFVILHGTDTMAYSASALAFMLENLGKPVVITGAQIPIFGTRSDGRDNLIASLVLAGNFDIPEVVIYFGNKVMRGCRTTKISSESLQAFDSPNQVPLGTVGVHFNINNREIFRPCTLGQFAVHTHLEPNVALLRIYPGITAAIIRSFMSEPIKGVVIQSFGAGNIPSNQSELLAEVHAAIDRGVLVVNITQCGDGTVAPIYETGAWMEMGVVAGCDLTQEAALTKLAYVLGQSKWDLVNKKKVMQISLRGEMTTNKMAKINDINLIEGVARTLHVSICRERDHMCSTFFPALVEAAIRENDVEKLKTLKQYGANLFDVNCEGRTALHLACFLGKVNCVRYLVDSGCPIDLTDRFNRTPLHEAIETDNHQIINMLLQQGAVLQDEPEVQAEQLRSLAEQAKIERLESYRLAGANLTLADRTGRTALHHACQLGRAAVVKYLLPFYGNPSVKDELGLGPIQYAKAGEHNDIVAMLCASKKI